MVMMMMVMMMMKMMRTLCASLGVSIFCSPTICLRTLRYYDFNNHDACMVRFIITIDDNYYEYA